MNFLFSTSIRTKVFGSILVSSLLTGALGVYCLIQAQKMDQIASHLGQEALPSVAKIGQLAFAVRSYRVKEALLGMHLLSGETDISKAEEEMTSEFKRANEAYDAFKPHISSAHEAELMRNFGALWTKVQSRQRDISNQISVGNQNRAVEIISDPALMLAADNILLKVLDLDEAQGAHAADVAVATYSSAFDAMVAGITLTVTLSLALGGLLVRTIVIPLSRSTDAIARLTEGDLNVDIAGKDRGDELGLLARSLELFKTALVDRRRMERDAEARRKAELERDELERHAKAEAEQQAESDRIAAEESRRRAEAAAIEHERSIVVSSIGAAMTKLAEKDLTYRMTQDIPDAYRRLKDDFNFAIGALEDAMAGVAQHTHSIESGTKEIASGADELARRTETQAAALEESAAALASITETVQNAAKGASHAREVVAVAKDDAVKSSDVVKSTVAAMGNIERSSQQIGRIIGVIDEIAFQTNLLALNAGVEAARAGDAGRGFAVVASEVRALAQRSAEAAKEIKALITTSSEQVNEGVALVAETGKSLDRILTQFTEINAVVADIASAAVEQATGIEQVNQAIIQMDQNTQQNASMAEETNAASQSLATDAGHLSSLVQQFDIGANAAPTPRGTLRPDATSQQVKVLRSTLKPAASITRQAAPKVVNGEDWEEF